MERIGKVPGGGGGAAGSGSKFLVIVALAVDIVIVLPSALNCRPSTVVLFNTLHERVDAVVQRDPATPLIP